MQMIHKFFKYLVHNQVLFALFILGAGWIIIQIRDILLSFFFSYIIVASLLPYVTFLRKKGLPNLFAVLIPFLIFILSIFLLIFPLIPFVVEQIQVLINHLPAYLKQANQTLGMGLDINQFQDFVTNKLDSFSLNAFNFTTQIFGGIFSLLMVFIITFYMLLYYDEFRKFFANLFSHAERVNVLATLDKTNEKLGAWLRGQILLMVFIGFLSWITLQSLGIPNALPLSLLAGILEIVPTLGPILSSVPAIIVALTISPTLAVTVTIIYIIIQAIENNFLVPKIMEKAVGLNPIVVILGVLIGANLIGFSGALLAIPIITFVVVIFKSTVLKE